MNSSQMIKQIKNRLGWPVIDIELSDDQISMCIDSAIMVAKDHIQIRRYKSYNIQKREDSIIPMFSYSVDLSDLDFDVVTEVYRGDSLTPYLYDQFYLVNYATRGVPESLALSINLRSNIEALINRQWKVVGKTLYLDKYYTGITIEFVPTVVSLEDIDDSYWVSWVMRYATAEAKEILGRVRGKYQVDSNPFKTDFDSLLSEASAERASLLEEIANRGLLEITR